MAAMTKRRAPVSLEGLTKRLKLLSTAEVQERNWCGTPGLTKRFQLLSSAEVQERNWSGTPVSLEELTKRFQLLSSAEVQERTWSDLILDLLILVVQRIDKVEDYFAFRAVCSQWRCAAAYEDFSCIRRQPWLLETNRHGSGFSNPFNSSPVSRSVETILPEKVHDVVGCKGWILVVHEDRIMELVHIMSGVRIRLPRHKASYVSGINKMVLSSSPFSNPLNYTLMIAYNKGHLAYWRPGDKTFTEVNMALICDVVFYNGFFYGVTSYGWIVAIKRCPSHPTATLAMKRMHPIVPSYIRSTVGEHIMYLVECDGDLLLVTRFEGEVDILDNLSPEILSKCKSLVKRNAIRKQQARGAKTTYFRVYKIEVGEYCSEVTEMKSLGNRALFVGGFSASFSVKASEIPGCKANHIYFTGQYRRETWRYREKHHTGVYSLKDGLVESYVCNKGNEIGCTCHCPPMWVTPTLV